jgi:hypothetical protein
VGPVRTRASQWRLCSRELLVAAADAVALAAQLARARGADQQLSGTEPPVVAGVLRGFGLVAAPAVVGARSAAAARSAAGGQGRRKLA